MPNHNRVNKYHLSLVVCCLFLIFLLRAFNISVQQPFVDEGLHAGQAETAWQLQENPGRGSEGKFLLYYWTGLFNGPRQTQLVVFRLSIALVAVLSGALIYKLGRILSGSSVGLIALFLYAVLPWAIFHERMILADPLATTMNCVVAYASLSLARRPTLRSGVLTGICLALATFAKLTLGLLPLLPVLATMTYLAPSKNGTEPFSAMFRRWFRLYFRPLCAAASGFILMWLPILIPAAIAYNTPDRFILVQDTNFGSSVAAFTNSVVAYSGKQISYISEYTSVPFLVVVLVALIYCLWLAIGNRSSARAVQFLLIWFMFSGMLTLAIATIAATRYLLPIAPPLVLILALTAHEIWNSPYAIRVIKTTIAAGLAAWLVLFVLPFNFTEIMHPLDLPFSHQNYTDYIVGDYTAEDTIRQIATDLNRLPGSVKYIYGDWLSCGLTYFYMQRPMTCFMYGTDVSAQLLRRTVNFSENETAYFLISRPFADMKAGVNGLCFQPVSKYERTPFIPIDLWSFHKGSC
jgi:4-amino-4-deoxy-L-arabinose transferase-like glycosyltransferase